MELDPLIDINTAADRSESDIHTQPGLVLDSPSADQNRISNLRERNNPDKAKIEQTYQLFTEEPAKARKIAIESFQDASKRYEDYKNADNAAEYKTIKDDYFTLLLTITESKVRYTLAKSMLGDESGLEEVISETYKNVYQRSCSFKGSAEVTTWIIQIAINKRADYYTKKAKQPVVVSDEIIALNSSNNSFVSPEEEMIRQIEEEKRKELARNVMSLANNLTKNQKKVVMLHFIDGLTHRDISNKLGITENASKQRLFKAMEKLRPKAEILKRRENRD